MRWYQAEFPRKGENLVVKCISSNDIGVYCQLLEYNSIEGFLAASEATKQRIRKISQIIPVDRVFVASVLSVDEKTRYIDLSKKHINREEIDEAESRYNKAKKLHSIITHLSSVLESGWSLSRLYELAWSIHPTPTMTHLKDILDQLPQESQVNKIRMHYLSPKRYEIQAEVEVMCFSHHGIEGIRESLLSAKERYRAYQLSIRLLSSPRYLLQLETTEEEKGISILDEVIVYIGVELRKRGGEIRVEKEPARISSEHKAEMEFRLKRLEAMSQERSGDEDSDSDSDS